MSRSASQPHVNTSCLSLMQEANIASKLDDEGFPAYYDECEPIVMDVNLRVSITS